MPYTPISAILAAIASAPASTWVDVACAVALVVCAVWDALRGFSATVAHVVALVASFKLAFLVCPAVRAAVPSGGSGLMSTLLPFLAAIVVLVVLFFAIRFLVEKFVRIVLVPPVDNVVGAVTGLVKGLILVYLAFALVSALLRKSYADSPFARSFTGRHVIPAVQKVAPAACRVPFAAKGK